MADDEKKPSRVTVVGGAVPPALLSVSNGGLAPAWGGSPKYCVCCGKNYHGGLPMCGCDHHEKCRYCRCCKPHCSCLGRSDG